MFIITCLSKLSIYNKVRVPIYISFCLYMYLNPQGTPIGVVPLLFKRDTAKHCNSAGTNETPTKLSALHLSFGYLICVLANLLCKVP